MKDHCQARSYCDLLTFQFQHNSSSGISIFLGNTSHFIPIQWHFKLSILDTEQQIYFNILQPKRLRKGNDLLRRSVQGNQIENIPWLKSQNFQSFKQFNTYLYKRYGHFCTSSSKNLNASHKGVLTYTLSFLALYSRLLHFMMII